jgi:prepilin-type N-terminal cleavage/methylation domain-containing protein
VNRPTHSAFRTPHSAVRSAGFTLVEVMVAVLVSAVLFGICVAIYVKVSRYKARSEKVLFIYQTASGIQSRMRRDLGGLHVSSTDADAATDLVEYWQLEKTPVAGCSGDRLTFLTATENPGKLDYCTVSYYVKSAKLYRKLSDSKGGSGPFSAEADSVLAEGVEKLTLVTEPLVPVDGKLPAKVTVTLKLADPGGKPGFREFTVTLRPGSEEN